MKRLLLLLSLGVLAISPAFAIDYEGLTLDVANETALGPPTDFGPAVFMVDYSNVTSFLGSGVANGGATLQGTNTITKLMADDIVPTGANAGYDVVQFKFSVVNFNSVPLTFRPRVRFWLADGAGGAPGTYYSVPAAVGYTFNPVTMNAGSATIFTATIPAGQFTMPGVPFWAGMTFDNNGGATGATAAQLNNLGQALFNPPTIGTSADQFFLTQAAGSFFPTNNPAGSLANLGGNPPANFGWEFTVDVPVGVEDGSWSTIKGLFR